MHVPVDDNPVAPIPKGGEEKIDTVQYPAPVDIPDEENTDEPIAELPVDDTRQEDTAIPEDTTIGTINAVVVPTDPLDDITAIPVPTEPITDITAVIPTTDPDPLEPRIIQVDAQQREFTPSNIVVQQGEDARLFINSLDMTHTASIVWMTTSTDENGYIVLDTSTLGTYTFRCSTYCGDWHNDMDGTITVQ